MKKYKIEKSKYPEDKNTHLVFMYSDSKYGCNIQRIFKGSHKECKEFLDEKTNNS